LPTPVFYPGAIERTSFAERKEPKGYFILDFQYDEQEKRYTPKPTFWELPTRPMVEIALGLGGKNRTQLETEISRKLSA